MRFLAVAIVLAVSSAGAQQRVMNGGLPNASPDGKWVVFASNRDGLPDLYLIGADGAGLRRLTSDSSREGIAGWTSDSREVVYTSSPPGPMSMTAVTTPLLAVDLTGRVRTVGTVVGRGGAISADGQRIAFSRGPPQASTMVVSSIDGSNARTLTDSSQAAAFNFAWSRDGRHIALTRMTLAPPRVLSIWLMAPDGSGARQLGDIPATEGSPQWPAWSPDGSRIAVQVGKYDRNDPTKNTAHIWVIDVATGRGTRLNPHDSPYLDETPSWIDNATIVFQSDRTGRMEIWAMSVDGKTARQLTR
jgi:Tol biopolymer transport system component